MTADTHEAAVARLREAYAAVPPGAPVRLAKRTSNLFRFRDAAPGASAGPAAPLDVSAFGHVLHVDPVRRTARVGGMTTYEDLADATLAHGLMPHGGAAAQDDHPRRRGHRARHRVHLAAQRPAARVGHRDGDPDRRRPRACAPPPDNEHADLFRGFPNSYGTLGYALSLTIELEPVRPFVHLRHFRVRHAEACMEAIGQIAAEGSLQRPPGRFRRRDRVRARRAVPDRRRVQRRRARGAATTPASRSTTSRSGGTRRTSSPSATTCGGGTPTGSGAPGPSACSSRWSGGCGRAATGARTSTASWSPSTGATASPTR